MTRREHGARPSLRFVVGTALLALGGACTSGAKAQSGAGAESQPPKHRKQDHDVCEPPDCHINPGPNEMPPQQPEPDAKPAAPATPP